MNFHDFQFDERIKEGLDSMGFETPTPIQEQAIPIILQNKDMIGCAQTGTGKTAAFILPLLHKILISKSDKIKALIITPTRELAQQIDQQLEGFAYFTGISSIAVYGGGDGMGWEEQKKALIQGADVIIATPGKLISHLNMGYVKFDELECLILDEADRMLDMGFHDDIMKIVSYLPEKRQSLLFSATMPDNIRLLTKKILKNPQNINIGVSKPAEGVLQAAYLVYDEQKIELIRSLVEGKDLERVLIFSSTKSNVKKIVKTLKTINSSVEEIHSDLNQSEREKTLLNFRNSEIKILVATDIVSRGIDIESIDLVVNYDVPGDAEDYIHRVGRTARSNKTGVAITFINKDDQFNFNKIEKLIEQEVFKIPLPNHIGEGPVYNPEAKPKFKKPKYGGNKRNFRK